MRARPALVIIVALAAEPVVVEMPEDWGVGARERFQVKYAGRWGPRIGPLLIEHQRVPADHAGDPWQHLPRRQRARADDGVRLGHAEQERRLVAASLGELPAQLHDLDVRLDRQEGRSEERRVGKECGAGWG